MTRLATYARWVERRRAAIVLGGGVLAAVGAVLALGLPLRADLSNLLPPQERSVRDLEQIERRTPILGLVLCAVASDDAGLRARGAQALAARIRALDPALVAGVVADDGERRRYAWDNRFLFAPLGDLETARDALRRRLNRAKLAANPLYVSLDDGDDDQAAAEQDRRLTELRRQLADAEEKARHPDHLVSKDRRLQLLIVETAFPSASTTQGERLVEALRDAMADTIREIGPGVELGMTEDVVIAVAEHRAVQRGMWLAALLTIAVVGASLFLYYRSGWAVAALLASLAAGTLVTFGLTRVVVGQLNSVTAFLSSIVVGNGINFGIIVLARHLEERRRGTPPDQALARAVGGSFAGTLTGALAAGAAYASLVVTDFRGFHDFGVIGGCGMLLCWLSAYTLLPALLSLLERWRPVRPRSEGPAGSAWLARLLPRRPGRVLAAGGVLVAVAALVTVQYLVSDPYEYDWQRMRSDRGLAREARRWMERIDEAFGRQLVGGFVVGVASPQDAATVERVLRAHVEAPAGEHRKGGRTAPPLFRKIGSLQDFVPPDQPEKLEVLAEIRRLLDDKALAALDDAEAASLRRLRPPDDLRLLTAADVPATLARRHVERDGTRGRLLFANQASQFDGWNGRDMIVFADAVRALELPPGTVMGGGAFVFADVIRAVARAGPRATAAAILGVAVVVILVVGWSRQAAITLACVAAGAITMLAASALLGIKVNFLDFVAVPITLGIGVDYSVNVVTRASAGGTPAQALASTGGAVMLCSWTTTVGYGSLLLSANAGIRSFGLMAIVGEATCLLTALMLAPALLALLERRT